MDVCKKLGPSAGRKITSVYIAKKCGVEPVQALLADPSFPNNFSLPHLTRVFLYLKMSKEEINFFNEALNRNIVDSNVEIEVKDVILNYKENVKHLEEKLSTYRQFINIENMSIDISNLEKYFLDDLSFFQSLSKDLLLVYEVPKNNTYYGKPIREILTDLGDLESWKGPENLHRYINRCKFMLSENEMFLEGYENLEHAEIEKSDAIKVQKSLQSLIKLCTVLMLNIQQRG